MNQTFEIPRARLEDLSRLHQFIDDFVEQARLDDTIVFALRLAIEEVCVNLIQHGYKGKPGLIRLTLDANAFQVTALIGDHAPPFPPEKAPRPVLDQNWVSRPIGGLGWHFIREMMDEIKYRSDPKQGNVLTLVKRLRSEK